jgi:hypothetical protein
VDSREWNWSWSTRPRMAEVNEFSTIPLLRFGSLVVLVQALAICYTVWLFQAGLS